MTRRQCRHNCPHGAGTTFYWGVLRASGELLLRRRITTFTGQSLKGPPGSQPFLKLADTVVDVLPGRRERTPAKGRAQGLALEFGKGRVVVLGEAGFLSAQLVGPRRRPFGMNVPGTDNRQLALNLMRWLARHLR